MSAPIPRATPYGILLFITRQNGSLTSVSGGASRRAAMSAMRRFYSP